MTGRQQLQRRLEDLEARVKADGLDVDPIERARQRVNRGVATRADFVRWVRDDNLLDGYIFHAVLLDTADFYYCARLNDRLPYHTMHPDAWCAEIISYPPNEPAPARCSDDLKFWAGRRPTAEELSNITEYPDGWIHRPDNVQLWLISNVMLAILELYEPDLRHEFAHDYPHGSQVELNRYNTRLPNSGDDPSCLWSPPLYEGDPRVEPDIAPSFSRRDPALELANARITDGPKLATLGGCRCRAFWLFLPPHLRGPHPEPSIRRRDHP